MIAAAVAPQRALLVVDDVAPAADAIAGNEMELLSVSFGCDVTLPNVVTGAGEFGGGITSSSNSSLGGVGRVAGGVAVGAN